MTVSSSIRHVTLEADGSDVAFDFSFPVFQASDLVVTLIAANGTETVANSSDYSVTINDDYTGTVTFDTAPVDGSFVEISRVVPLTQLSDISNQRGFFPTTIEQAFDRNVMQAQQIADDLSDTTDRVTDAEADIAALQITLNSLNDADWSIVNMKIYNPMEAQYGASGTGLEADDDTEAVQAVLDAIKAGGTGGVLYLTNPHTITGELTYVDGPPLVITGPHPAIGYFVTYYNTDKTLFTWSASETSELTTSAPIISNIGVFHAGTAGYAGTAFDVSFDYAGAFGTPCVVKDCVISRLAGTGYFEYGMKFYQVPLLKIFNNTVYSQGGFTNNSVKQGAGISLGTWCMAPQVFENKIRGFSYAVEISERDTTVEYVATSGQTEFAIPWAYRLESLIIAYRNGVEMTQSETPATADEYSLTGAGDPDGGGVLTLGAGATLSDEIFIHHAFQCEGMEVRGNQAQSCLWGFYCDLNHREITGEITDNFFDTMLGGIYLRNKLNCTIADNWLLAQNRLSDHVGVMIQSDEANDGATAPTLSPLNINTVIARNHGGRYSNIRMRVTNLSLGATTVVTYIEDIRNTGVLVNGDIIYLNNANGADELNGRPYKVGSHNSGAKTFELLDYYTGASINSSAYTAWVSSGYFERYRRLVEIKSGARIYLRDNQLLEDQVGVHLWPQTKYIEINDTILEQGVAPLKRVLINDSANPTTVIIDDGVLKPASEDGSSFDDNRLATMLDASPIIKLQHGATYRFRKQHSLPTGCIIRGDGSQTFIMDIKYFTNADRTLYTDATANLFLMDGVSRVTLEGFKIIPSIQVNGRVRIAIEGIDKPATIEVTYAAVDDDSFDVFDDGQYVTLYGMTGADEIDAITLAGTGANPTQYKIQLLDEDAKTFRLVGTAAVVLTPWTSGGYIEPKRFLAPIAVQECDGVKIENVEVSGFTAGYAYAIDSSTNIELRPLVKDWWTSFVWQTAAEAQQSAVEIDQNRISNVGSENIRVVGGLIKDLQKGLPAIYQQDSATSPREQSDGVHAAGQTNSPDLPTQYVIVDSVTFCGVDEAVDCAGNNVHVVNCMMSDIHSHAMKCVYGASNIRFAMNFVEETGRHSVLISAGTTSVADTDNANITIESNTFLGVSNRYDALGVEYTCLQVDDNGTSGYRGIKRVVVRDNDMRTGTSGVYCIDNALRQYTSELFLDGNRMTLDGAATGYINRPRERRLPITGISQANPGVVTLAANSEVGMLSNGLEVAIYDIGGMVEITDGMYEVGSNPSGGSFELNTTGGVDIDTSGYTAYTSGGYVHVGGRVFITNITPKAVFKATLQADQTIPAATLDDTLQFTTHIFDSSREGSIADEGYVADQPGYRRVTVRVRTGGAVVTETLLSVLTTGAGAPLIAVHRPASTSSYTYEVSGIVWCDEGDVITAKMTLAANAGGITFTADHNYTHMIIETL